MNRFQKPKLLNFKNIFVVSLDETFSRFFEHCVNASNCVPHKTDPNGVFRVLMLYEMWDSRANVIFESRVGEFLTLNEIE